jgi:stage III sporulation protein AA
MTTNIKYIPQYLPARISQAIEGMSTSERDLITEIRFRVNRPVEIVSGGKNPPKFLCQNGSLTTFPNISLIITSQEIEQCFNAICNYSVHSFEKEIAQGFITLSGGNRVGLSGSMSVNSGIATLKYINSLNFRIAKQVPGCATELFNSLRTFPSSVLIIGKPASGKTTILRDLCRIAGKTHRVSLIDERHEIASLAGGIPQNDVGDRTDVFDGYPKHNGIETALRVMSPEIIICDEIGTQDDIKAIENCLYSGVSFIASAHASTRDEVYSRPYLKNIMSSFNYLVVLDNFKVSELLAI